jgi:hyaluronan synthase
MVGVTPLPQQKNKAGVGIGTRMTLVTVLAAVVVFVVTFKVLSFENLRDEPVWATYGFVITGFIFARFGLGFCYRPRRTVVTGYRPTVAIIVPAYNEPDIAKTLVACLSVDYPKELIRVVVVDDKSTDETLWRINAVAEEYPELTVIPQPVNQGKRHAMATGIAAADDVEVFVFIDSDSQVAPDAVKTLMSWRPVGAVAGHTDVANAGATCDPVQAMQYYIAFGSTKRRGAVRLGDVLLGLLLGLPP